jgi:hypothetical protein
VAHRVLQSLEVVLLALAALILAPAAAAARTSDILRLRDFPSGWETTPVVPSDNAAPPTPACAALAKQQAKSVRTVGTPKFVDPQRSSEFDVVAASVTTMPSARAAKQQVVALLRRRLTQCLVDGTEARLEANNPGADATTVLHEVHLPHTDKRVRALEATTTVTGFDGFEYTQQVVFVRDGKHIATLHVDTDERTDYTALRDRLVRIVQRRLHRSEGVDA